MKNDIKRSVLSVFIAAAVSGAAAHAEEKKTEISGLIEVEAGFTNSDAGDESDITLATVELGIDHAVNDKVDGHVLFLYEEGENNDNIAVDEAVITLHATDQLDIAAGRMYVPFGNFDSMMVSDPLTLEVGETQEEALQLGFSNGAGLGGSVYVYKDDEDASAKIDDFGLSVAYESEGFAAGVSYISDVNDKSDANNDASGLGVHAKGSFGKATIIAEHIQVDTTAAGEKPEATNLEFGFDLGGDRTIALALQETDDAVSLGLPEKAIGIAYSMPVYEQASFAAEYMKNDQYDGSDDSVVTLQLAYEF